MNRPEHAHATNSQHVGIYLGARVRVFGGVRLHTGTLGVDSQTEAGVNAPLSIQTAFATIDVKDAVVGIESDSGKTSISVQRGGVDILDLAHHKHGELLAGKSARVNSARGIVTNAGALNEPAGAAAAKIVGTFTSVADPDAGDNSIKEMRAPAKSSFEVVAVATPAAMAVAAPAKPVKAPAIGAPGVSTAAPGADDAPPIADNTRFITDVAHFSWSEGRNGQLVMTPLFKIVFGLHGMDAAMFWPCLLFVFIFLGLFLQLTLRDVAFGGFYNTFIMLGATCAAIGIRDVLLVDASYLHYEPFLTVGASLIVLVSMMGAIRLIANRID